MLVPMSADDEPVQTHRQKTSAGLSSELMRINAGRVRKEQLGKSSVSMLLRLSSVRADPCKHSQLLLCFFLLIQTCLRRFPVMFPNLVMAQIQHETDQMMTVTFFPVSFMYKHFGASVCMTCLLL